MSEVLLETSGLKKYFRLSRGQVLRAVDGIDLYIRKGETLGLVGESGCGKSTLGRIILRLYKPTAGTVKYCGNDIFRVDRIEARNLCREIQMVFQDPYASLNPRMTAGEIVGEALDIHGLVNRNKRTEKILEFLIMVGLEPDHASRFPHQFSGGQRQRIGIARALAVNPSLIVCDEPISALDVSIQAQIVNLLRQLQNEHNLTYLFISHDLSMVKYISDRIAVMYLGKIVELAASEELNDNPKHPYTKALLSAIPVPDPRVEKTRQRIILAGDMPSQTEPSQGCLFSSRCPESKDICFRESPSLNPAAPNHHVACHFA